jgi:hypothetical protein
MHACKIHNSVSMLLSFSSEPDLSHTCPLLLDKIVRRLMKECLSKNKVIFVKQRRPNSTLRLNLPQNTFCRKKREYNLGLDP